MLLIGIPLVWLAAVALAVALCRSAAREAYPSIKRPIERRAPARRSVARLGASERRVSYRSWPAIGGCRPCAAGEPEPLGVRQSRVSATPHVRRPKRQRNPHRLARPRRAHCLRS